MTKTHWKKYKLNQIMEIIGGGTPKTTVSEYWDGDIPWLSVIDFAGRGRWVDQTEKHITPKGLKESSTKILKKGQLIISARGTVGEIAQIGCDMTFNQSCYGLDGKLDIVLNNFLYYLLKFNMQDLKQNTHGAVFDTITRQTFDCIDVDVPSIAEQRAIAKILGDLDEKIELNHQMNKTLEALGQVLFKRWFVGETNNSISGKLGDICERITKGTTPTTLKKSFVREGVNFIKVESIDDVGNILQDKLAYIDEETNHLLSRSIIQENDILYTIAGTIGRTAVATPEVLPANTNQAVAIIRLKNKPLYLSYVRLLLRTSSISEKFQSRVVHAVQANLSLGEISETEILIPDERTLIKFNRQVDHIFLAIGQNTSQTNILKAIRDSLLPKLMSGLIRV